MPDAMARAGAEPADVFSITFDGEPVRVLRGQTIAAALVASGRTSWRSSRGTGGRRGLYCGIGVCFDCLVTVNGVESVRACLAAAEPGDAVTTQEGAGHRGLAV